MFSRFVSEKQPQYYYLRGSVAVALSLVAAVSTVSFLAVLNKTVLHSVQSVSREVFLGACFLSSATVSSYFSQILMFRASYDFVHDVRMKLIRQLADAPLERIETFGVEKIITVLNDDVRAFVSFFAFIPNAFTSLLIFAGCTIYLFYLDPFIGLMVSLGLVGILFIGGRATLHATHVLLLARADDEAIRRGVTQLTAGAKEVKLSNDRRQKLVERDLATRSRSATRHYVRSMHHYRLNDEVVKVAYFGFFLVALAYAALEPKFGVAGAGSVIILLFFMQSPFQLINYGWERITPFRIAVKKIRELQFFLEAHREGGASATGLGTLNGWNEIDVRELAFSYATIEERSSFKLGPVSIKLKKGDLVFVAGANGSGKTTFGKLLSGLYTPTEGWIEVDGCGVSPELRLPYRQLFSVIFSDKYLFDELCPGHNVTMPSVQQLLERLNLHHKVTIAGWKFSTTDLSVGQKDRLALLDALVQCRSIMIFDEWPANQDPAFRAWFYTELLPELKAAGHTLIVMSHDDRFYHLADRLWYFEDGSLSENPSSVALATTLSGRRVESAE